MFSAVAEAFLQLKAAQMEEMEPNALATQLDAKLGIEIKAKISVKVIFVSFCYINNIFRQIWWRSMVLIGR